METNLSRFKKISQILSGSKPKFYSRIAKLSPFLKKTAAYSTVINSWEDLETEFGDSNSEIKQKWEAYVDDYDLDPLRTKDIKSFLDFYNRRGIDLLPEEAQLEEEKLLPEIKNDLKELLASKGETEEESEEEDVASANNSNKVKALGVFGDKSPSWLPNGGFENGPQQHQKRHGKNFNNWQSNNGWDLLGPAGTVVHSLTKGKVGSIKASSSGAYNVFGTHISINGLDGYPNVFYTHVDSVMVKPGDIVEVGTPIAQITTPPQPPPDKDGKERKSQMPHHVHVGVEGAHISSLISSSGKFKQPSSLRKVLRTFV